MADILLLNPNVRWQGGVWHEIPYSLCLLKGFLNGTYDAKVLDANFDDLTEEQLVETLKRLNPPVVGMACISMEYHKVFQRTAQLVRQALPHAPLIVGGVYATVLPEQVMSIQEIDYLVMGEGEYRLLAVLNHIHKKEGDLSKVDGLALRQQDGSVKIQPVINYIEDLNVFPYPDFSDLDFAAYANVASRYRFFSYPRRFPSTIMVSSRGCPFHCIFCSSSLISGNRIRFRSAEHVLGEIDRLVQDYGVKDIVFLDDNMSLDKRRFKKILQGLIDRNYDLTWKNNNIAVYTLNDEILELMRKSGCHQLVLPLESGSLETLRYMKKPIRNLDHVRAVVKKAKELGFDTCGLFVIGFPNETWDMIRETVEFADSLRLDYSSFSIATPLPQTELLDIVREQNLLLEGFSFDEKFFFGFGRCSITTESFTPEELEILRAYEWDRLNFRTPEQKEVVARINGLSLEELEQWRLRTRRDMIKRVKSYG
ncbi:MAG: radical SAM protein [Magnetococcales bacterium]|nr:radical SAM protein [Magnetococcales bacterium]